MVLHNKTSQHYINQHYQANPAQHKYL